MMAITTAMDPWAMSNSSAPKIEAMAGTKTV
jgi:hypothetical protein